MEIRNNWTREEVEKIFNQPFLDLVYQAAPKTLEGKLNDVELAGLPETEKNAEIHNYLANTHAKLKS